MKKVFVYIFPVDLSPRSLPECLMNIYVKGKIGTKEALPERHLDRQPVKEG